MELRFNIDDETIEGLHERTGMTKGSDLAQDAFNLLGWATQQTAAGRHVGSYEMGGDTIIGYEVGAMRRARANAKD